LVIIYSSTLMAQLALQTRFVIPAKAGIHPVSMMDPRFRGDDNNGSAKYIIAFGSSIGGIGN
jgi:hypothetical protein